MVSLEESVASKRKRLLITNTLNEEHRASSVRILNYSTVIIQLLLLLLGDRGREKSLSQTTDILNQNFNLKKKTHNSNKTLRPYSNLTERHLEIPFSGIPDATHCL